MTRATHGPTGQTTPKTLIIGLSGPSSSGKTTLARLLRTIFTPPRNEGAAGGGVGDVSTFIIHEDDFYKSDDKIPVTRTAAGKLVEDWDTIEAIDVGQLTSTLKYVRSNGCLPPRLKSKEDLNEATDSGVDDAAIERARREVTQRLKRAGLRLEEKTTEEDGGRERQTPILSLALLEGFLLYAPPDEESHTLRHVRDLIDVPIFLPATYPLLKERREGRTGYVTIGPAPTPTLKDEEANGNNSVGAGGEKDGREGGQIEENFEEEDDDDDDNDDDDDDDPPPNFWTDPPGYVDDIVWPRYIRDHSWLLVPESARYLKDENELRRIVGDGRDVREDMGILIAPGKGEAPMLDVFEWAVEETLRAIEAALALYD
ncbi:hypothetical protein AJ80_00963 [Polytolypa hystricis UAMH7299]|uniref:Phosphoribulokinase/uridine kinase domain-containing protein n=1 Tax=Polytolypa hystricis (strain UAMH7299) TaxID=1447883 RepID=A0A2B7Z1Y9_POLH7|nr:hypothetical protein AJ80_00963 [Polytolypa hystricis UAMH7299]